MSRQALGVALLLTIAAVVAGAQRPLPVGARVRVAIFERQAQQESRIAQRQYIRGELESVSGDTLYVRPSPQTGLLAIPRSSVERLHRSLGVPRRLPSAIGTGLGGAVMLALEAAILYSPGRRTFGADNRGDAALNAAKVGGAVFGVIGFLWPAERWRRVPLYGD